MHDIEILKLLLQIVWIHEKKEPFGIDAVRILR